MSLMCTQYHVVDLVTGNKVDILKGVSYCAAVPRESQIRAVGNQYVHADRQLGCHGWQTLYTNCNVSAGTDIAEVTLFLSNRPGNKPGEQHETCPFFLKPFSSLW